MPPLSSTPLRYCLPSPLLYNPTHSREGAVKPVAYIIAQPCIGTKDTACVVVCPVDCIHPKKDEPDFEKEEMLYIDPDTCIDCNMCVDECPVTAIFPQDDLPAEWISFVERNAAYYKK